MNKETRFHLREGVQVRREKFGLLFYDYRGPRLYFVPSGDLVGDDFFDGRESRKVGGPDVRRLLESLEKKGLLERREITDEQPLC